MSVYLRVTWYQRPARSCRIWIVSEIAVYGNRIRCVSKGFLGEACRPLQSEAELLPGTQTSHTNTSRLSSLAASPFCFVDATFCMRVNMITRIDRDRRGSTFLVGESQMGGFTPMGQEEYVLPLFPCSFQLITGISIFTLKFPGKHAEY